MNQTGKNRRLLLILLSVVLSFSTLFGTVATNAYAESPVELHVHKAQPGLEMIFHFIQPGISPEPDIYIDITVNIGPKGSGTSSLTDLNEGDILLGVDVYLNGHLVDTITQADIGHRSDKTKKLMDDGSMSGSGTFEANTGEINFWYERWHPDPTDDPGVITVTLLGHKYTVNAPLTDELFEFVVTDPEDDDAIITTGTNDEDGIIVFDGITYTLPADTTFPVTYTYEVREVPLAPNPGWTQDPTVYTVSITINNDGTTAEPVLHAVMLILDPADTDDIEFTNTWPPEPDPDPASVIIHATKEVRGTTLVADMFEFLLADEDVDFYLTSTNDADGNIEFGPIEFDEEGEYIFYILELNEDGNNWTIDKSVFEVKVTVTIDREDDSKLVANVEYPEGGVVFVNTYKVPDNTPKTGDIALLLLLGAGLMALGGTSALVQRKRSAQK